MAISMLKIRRPLGRLIFNMGIAIPGKTVFLIETAPCCFIVDDGVVVTGTTLMSIYDICMNAFCYFLRGILTLYAMSGVEEQYMYNVMFYFCLFSLHNSASIIQVVHIDPK